jgi:hypothetical protein
MTHSDNHFFSFTVEINLALTLNDFGPWIVNCSLMIVWKFSFDFCNEMQVYFLLLQTLATRRQSQING